MPKIIAPWMIKRELLIRSEAKTDPKWGKKPEERPYPDFIKLGAINLDKPPGPSSHEVAAWVRSILVLRKIGHGGTLEV
jgi:H/ACA ribonucleoprotein complex subunit 4